MERGKLQQEDLDKALAFQRERPDKLGRILVELGLLSQRLRSQQAQGRAYLMGAQLTALDIYWAAMAALLDPLPPALCKLPEGLRKSYTATQPEIVDALDPALIELRDTVYERFLELPIEL